MSNSEQGRDDEKMEDVALLLCGHLRPEFGFSELTKAVITILTASAVIE